MKDYGKLIDSNTLQFQRILEGSIDQVWEYLVDADKRALWFAGGPTDVRPDGKMELIFRNSHLSDPPDPTPERFKEYGDGYKSEATILKVDKPTELVINWEGGIITFHLESLEDEKVKFTLTHEKLQEGKDYKVGTLAGWHTHLDILDNLLSEKTIQGFWIVHMKLMDDYSQLIDEKKI